MEEVQKLSYFKFTPWYYWLGVFFLGFGDMIIGVFCPEIVPYDLLGPLGSFLYYMHYSQRTLLKLILAVATLIHIGEGLYAYVLTRRMNLTRRDSFLWVTQTIALGFSSLLPLKEKYREITKKM